MLTHIKNFPIRISTPLQRSAAFLWNLLATCRPLIASQFHYLIPQQPSNMWPLQDCSTWPKKRSCRKRVPNGGLHLDKQKEHLQTSFFCTHYQIGQRTHQTTRYLVRLASLELAHQCDMYMCRLHYPNSESEKIIIIITDENVSSKFTVKFCL